MERVEKEGDKEGKWGDEDENRGVQKWVRRQRRKGSGVRGREGGCKAFKFCQFESR